MLSYLSLTISWLLGVGREVVRVSKELMWYSSPVVSELDFSVVSQLLFVELFQGAREFLAMVDTGAMCNVVASNLVKEFEGVHLCKEGPRQLSTANRTLFSVVKWVSVPFSLSSGQQVRVRFAVVTDLSRFIIVGLPALNALRAKIDVGAKVLRTSCGIVPLFSAIPQSAVHQVAPTVPCGGVSLRFVDSKDDSKVETKDGSQTAEAQLDAVLNESSGASEDELMELRDLLVEYNDLWLGNTMGKCNIRQHKIELHDDVPLRQRPRRYTEAQQQEIEKQVGAMIESGVIQPSSSRNSSEILLVPKPGGNWVRL